jgi:putative ABC transport system permease protein
VAPWRQLARGVRALCRRSAADREVAEEVQSFLDEATAAHLARGLSPQAARRAALLEVGSIVSVRERVRVSGWENRVATALADLRYAVRQLRANPGFTAVAALTFALGLGAMTAIWSAVKPVLFEPLPYPHAGRIAMIWEVGRDGARNATSFGLYSGMAERARSFAALALLKPWQPTMTGPGRRPERFEGQRVSASYFRTLGVAPVLGRDLLAADDRPGAPPVVVLSDGLWRRRFGADPGVVGRQITLDDGGWLVAGVMPRGFDNVLAPAAELWAPLQYDLSEGRAWGHHLRMVGRLRPGAGAGAATRELNALGNAVLRERHPETYGSEGVELATLPLHEEVTRGVRPALVAVAGAVCLLLAIAGVNVTGLLMARGARRRGELAVRAALGAGRGRLVRQLLVESLLLAVLGGAVGMAAAALGVRALLALSPQELPRAGAIHLDGAVFAFGLGLATLAGLAAGLAPALHAARGDLHLGLQESSRRTAGARRATRGALVVVEVALALVLLVGSGLLLRSLQRMFAVAPGFDPRQLLTLQVQTSGRRFADDAAVLRFFEQALEAVRRVPGVAAASFTSQLPLSGDADVYGVHFQASDAPRGADGDGAFRYAVSPGYFEALGIPLRRGRLLDSHDTRTAPPVVVLNESYAKRKFQRVDAIGQRLHVGPDDGPWYTVAGVVGDVKQLSLAADAPDAVYMTAAQWRFADAAMSFAVRARGDAAALVPAVSQAVWSVDKDVPVVRVALMQDVVARTAAERRFALDLFAAFALAALALAAAGIYGVLAGSVAERRREIGVRAALGASRRSIVALVLREGFTLAGLGAVLGLAGAAAASQALAALLFGVSRHDPVAYVGVLALLAAVALAACCMPAWNALRIDPASTLRTD